MGLVQVHECQVKEKDLKPRLSGFKSSVPSIQLLVWMKASRTLNTTECVALGDFTLKFFSAVDNESFIKANALN